MSLNTKFNARSVRVRTTVGAALALGLLVLVSGALVNWLVAREVRASANAGLLEQAQDRAALLNGGNSPQSLVNAVGDEVVVVVASPTGQVIASAGTPTPQLLVALPTGLTTAEVELEGEESGDDDESGDDGSDESGDDGEEGRHEDSDERERDESVEPADRADGGDIAINQDADATVIPSPTGAHVEELQLAVATAADGRLVIVGAEGERVRTTVNRVQTVLLTGGPLVALAGAVIAWLITGRALAPVHRMRRDLDEVVNLSGSQRVTEPGSGDEIDALATTMNEVLDRLEEQSAIRQRFVADASHELKSPLANARVLIETAGEVSSSDDGRLRSGVLGELDRLQALVDDLLYLARTDETSAGRPDVMDLDDIVFDEAERVALGGTKTVDAGGVQPARVVGDRPEVARAVRNLLENAVRYARTDVAVALGRDGPWWVLSVTDDGPGIPVTDRQRVFERFARLDDDRTRLDGGTGLGLSIVATIADRNGGSVAVAERDGGGARFELRLPAAGHPQ